MNAIRLSVCVPLAVAVRAGSPTYGTMTVELSEAVLSVLTEAEREALASLVREERGEIVLRPWSTRGGADLSYAPGSLVLPSHDVSSEAVLAALQAFLAVGPARRAELAARLAQQEAERPAREEAERVAAEQKRQAAKRTVLGARPGLYVDDHGAFSTQKSPPVVDSALTLLGVDIHSLSTATSDDAEIAAWLDGVRAAAAATRETLARRTEQGAALVAWVAERDETVRTGMARGYEMRRGAHMYLTDVVRAAISSYDLLPLSETDENDQLESRESPESRALMIEAAISAAIEGLGLPAGARVSVGTISRLTILPDDDDREQGPTYRTVVPVVLHALGYRTGWAVVAE